MVLKRHHDILNELKRGKGKIMADAKAQALELAKTSATRADVIMQAVRVTAAQEDSSIRLESLRAQHDASVVDKTIEDYKDQLIESKRQLAREAHEQDINIIKKRLINDYRYLVNVHLLKTKTMPDSLQGASTIESFANCM